MDLIRRKIKSFVMFSLVVTNFSLVFGTPTSGLDTINAILANHKTVQEITEQEIKLLVQTLKDKSPNSDSGLVASIVLGYIGLKAEPFLKDVSINEKDPVIRYRANLALECMKSKGFGFTTEKMTSKSTDNGIIEGPICFFVDETCFFETTCADNLITGKRYCTSHELRGNQFNAGVGYKLEVPSGDYYVFAGDNLLRTSIPTGIDFSRAYHVDCDLTMSDGCKSHEPSIVHVEKGKVVNNIDLSNYYNVNFLDARIHHVPDFDQKEVINEYISQLRENPDVNTIDKLASLGGKDPRVVVALKECLRRQTESTDKTGRAHLTTRIISAFYSLGTNNPRSDFAVEALVDVIKADSSVGTGLTTDDRIFAVSCLRGTDYRKMRSVLPGLLKAAEGTTGVLKTAILETCKRIE